MWDRVGQVIANAGIGCKLWQISDLLQVRVFADAVQAAEEADVLVVSVRDAGELPLCLHVWIETWLQRRAVREGALVALIGVPAQPDTQCGHAYQYLQSVARGAGLDFLPRERKLPEEPLVCFTPLGILQEPTSRCPWSESAAGPEAGARLQ